jgi:predicted nucleic acid-binding protein
MEATPVRWRFRPSSPDPDDDFVIEAAFNARADVLVTTNRRHLATPLAAFGIRTAAPGMLLYERRSSP